MSTTRAYRINANLAELEANAITVKNSNSVATLTKGRLLFHMQAVWGRLGLVPTKSSVIRMNFTYANDHQPTQKQLEEALTTKNRVPALQLTLQSGWGASKWVVFSNTCSCIINRRKQAPREGQESLIIELSEIISFYPGKTTKIWFDFFGFEKEGSWSSESDEIIVEKVVTVSVAKLAASKYTLRLGEKDVQLRWQTLKDGKLNQETRKVPQFDAEGAWQTFEKPVQGEETSTATLSYMPPQIKTDLTDEGVKVEVNFSDQTIISIGDKPLDKWRPTEAIPFTDNLRIRCSGYFYSIDQIIYHPKDKEKFKSLVQTVYLFDNGSRLLRLEWSSDKEIQFYVKGTPAGKGQLIDKGKQGEWEYLFGYGDQDYSEILMVDKSVAVDEAFRLIL